MLRFDSGKSRGELNYYGDLGISKSKERRRRFEEEQYRSKRLTNSWDEYPMRETLVRHDEPTQRRSYDRFAYEEPIRRRTREPIVYEEPTRRRRIRERVEMKEEMQRLRAEFKEAVHDYYREKEALASKREASTKEELKDIQVVVIEEPEEEIEVETATSVVEDLVEVAEHLEQEQEEVNIEQGIDEVQETEAKQKEFIELLRQRHIQQNEFLEILPTLKELTIEVSDSRTNPFEERGTDMILRGSTTIDLAPNDVNQILWIKDGFKLSKMLSRFRNRPKRVSKAWKKPREWKIDWIM